MPRREPTQEELQAAWERCRQPSWPDAFEVVMEHPLLSRLVRLTALHPPRATPRSRAELASAASMPAVAPRPARSPRTFPQTSTAAHRGVIDRKRAAAGDRDDD